MLDLQSTVAVRGLIPDERGRWRLVEGGTSGDVVFQPQEHGPTGRITPSWIAQWTAPRRFEKHPGNPIYGPHKSGPWDHWTNGVSIVPTADGKTYRMYYAGKEGEGIGFAEASIDDPLTWREHSASPVLRPRTDNWEGNRINQPRVVAVTDQHWRMYYTGWGFVGPGSPWAMGLAESFDGGTTWRRAGDEPILDRGDASSPDGGGACVPMIRRIGDRWMMWYTAGMVNKTGNQNIHLCLATSSDGVHWEKHPGNPVLSDDFSDGAVRSVTSRCYVRHDDGVFRMWYSFAKPAYRIHYAESLDGIEWERSPSNAPVLDVSPSPAWDDRMVEYPEVQIVDGRYRLWFCGNDFGSVGFAEGVPATGVNLFARSGDTRDPDDGTWTDWKPLARNRPFDAQRYVQIRAELWSRAAGASPTLNSITLS
jgi:predicted GH43/DUF377 family glycosyl hydrolase